MTKGILYSIITFLASLNIENHLDFKKSLFHFVSMLSTSFVNYKCLLGACFQQVFSSRCQGFGINSQGKSPKVNQIKFMSLNL